MNPDVIVIGGGPGGYVAALRGARRGLKVALVEAQDLGGVCLNWGCIPTKTLLENVKRIRDIKSCSERGIFIEGLKFDIPTMIAYSRQVVEKLTQGVVSLLKKHNVSIHHGWGSLVGKNSEGKWQVKVQKEKSESFLCSSHVILATGSTARTLPFLKLDGEGIWTAKEALSPPFVPERLLILGAGAIGLEFACFYRSVGIDVTVVEMQSQILPTEDEDMIKSVHKSFVQDGIHIHVNTRLQKVETRHENNLKKIYIATLSDAQGKEFFWEGEAILLAIGVIPNVHNLGLETTNIKLHAQGYIPTDPSSLETSEKGLYAIGDVTAPPWLAHKASHEGIVCMDYIIHILQQGESSQLSNHQSNHQSISIPSCIYTLPQVARIGLTESEAQNMALSEGFTLKIGRFPYLANGKALSSGHPEGLVKTIFRSDTGELLGAHIVGSDATEILGSYVVAMGLEATEESLKHLVWPHPTLSEMIHESVLLADQEGLHWHESWPIKF